MATRTVQILGMGFGSSSARVTATANGTQVFTGTVTTVNQPVPQLPNFDLLPDQTILFTFEIDTAFTGQIPMTCTVENGTVIFGDIQANYVPIANPVYSPEQISTLQNPSTTRSQKLAIWTQVATPPFTAEELATLEDPNTSSATVAEITNAHGCAITVGSGASVYSSIDDTDARSNVVIDGVAQLPDRGDLPGTWWWTINNGSTLSYNLDVDPAKG